MDFASTEIKSEIFPKIKILNSLGFEICSQLQLKTLRVADKFENAMFISRG